jgi:hypothetical protein
VIDFIKAFTLAQGDDIARKGGRVLFVCPDFLLAYRCWNFLSRHSPRAAHKSDGIFNLQYKSGGAVMFRSEYEAGQYDGFWTLGP